MNNIRTEEVTPAIAGGTIGAFGRISAMLLVGLVIAAVALYFIPDSPDELSI
jgi:hypothetical protein